MILRRLVDNLRQQNWTAITIELVVLVLGVFIGIQASNWNEERETDRRAAVFTERLKDDLRAEAWGYAMQVTYYGDVLANSRRAADALTDKSVLDDEALLISAYRATQFNGTRRRRATYDELLSTGEIGLIRDRALRDLALDVYTEATLDEVVQEGRDSEYRNAFRRLMPHAVQQVLATQCGDQLSIVGDYDSIEAVLDYPCQTGLPADVIADCAVRLRGDPTLVPLLQLHIADIQTSLATLSGYNAELWSRLRAVAGESP
jgi:hypothetical protein